MVKIIFLTLGTLVHFRHFKLGCGFAALCYCLFFSNEVYKYLNSSDFSRNDTVKNAVRAAARGIRSLMNFIISFPSPVGIVLSVIQHVMHMKKVAINVLRIDAKMCLYSVILSFLWRMANRIII